MSNVLGPDGYAGVIRPTLTPLATFTMTPETQASVTAQIQSAVDAAAGRPAEERMVEVVYMPGTYTALWGGYVYARSSTGNPLDVVIESDVTGGGTHHQYDAPLAVFEGLTLRSLTKAGEEGPKYPLHVTSQNGTQVWSRCRFVVDNTAKGNAVGLDGGDGLSLHFFECEFDNHGLAPLFNIHGAPQNVEGVSVSFVNCSTVGETPTDVAYNALSDLSRDRITVTGGNLTKGALTGALTEFGPDGIWEVPVGGLSRQHRYTLLHV